MNKCEWEDGEFKSCNHLYAFKDTIRIAWIYCPYCGADIRKPEPKAPSHEEIMTLWWEINEDIWVKVHLYNNSIDRSQEEPMYIFDALIRDGHEIIKNQRYSVSKEWFIVKRSATIPPEKE